MTVSAAKTDTLTGEITDELISLRDGLLHRSDDRVLLNPECVKYVLQRYLVENRVDLLFHVLPVEAAVSGGEIVEIRLMGREGEIVRAAGRYIDASEEYGLPAAIPEAVLEMGEAEYNVFTGVIPSDFSGWPDGIRQRVVLPDNRHWLSMRIPGADRESIFRNMHARTSELQERLTESDYRLQLTAAQPYIRFTPGKGGTFRFPENLHTVLAAYPGIPADTGQIEISAREEMKL